MSFLQPNLTTRTNPTEITLREHEEEVVVVVVEEVVVTVHQQNLVKLAMRKEVMVNEEEVVVAVAEVVVAEVVVDTLVRDQLTHPPVNLAKLKKVPSVRPVMNLVVVEVEAEVEVVVVVAVVVIDQMVQERHPFLTLRLPALKLKVVKDLKEATTVVAEVEDTNDTLELVDQSQEKTRDLEVVVPTGEQLDQNLRKLQLMVLLFLKVKPQRNLPKKDKLRKRRRNPNLKNPFNLLQNMNVFEMRSKLL